MATIIDLGNGQFIAGDPDPDLHEGNHWCMVCYGNGLDVDFNDELAVCGMCAGFGQVKCDGPDCTEHAS